MSSEAKGSITVLPALKWIKIVNVLEHCVQEVAKLAVREFNSKYGNNLIYESIFEGWYMELKDKNLKYRLIICVIDCLKRKRKFEAIVFEQNPGRIRTLISFTHFPPIIVENWIQIPIVEEHCVQAVANLAVDLFNKKHDNNLKFVSIFEGWYLELDSTSLKYRIHIKAKDCLGRVRLYEAFVLEKKVATERIRTLISFELM